MHFSASPAKDKASSEAKSQTETKKSSKSEHKKSTDDKIEQEPKLQLDKDLNDNRLDDKRSKKTSSKKKSKLVNQHDDRVEVESNSRTESPQIDKRVTRSMTKKQEPRLKIEHESNRAEQKSPKAQKKPKSELEFMQDGLDRLVIVNRNAKSKSNRDSKPRKSTDRKPTKLLKDPVHKELKPGHSKWFPGDTRPDWTRPCFKDFEHVIIGDSQLKIYGQQKKEKKGFSITSFSGCDVSFTKYIFYDNNLFYQLLEFLNVLRVGFLSCERDRRGDVAILSRADIRKEYGLSRKGFKYFSYDGFHMQHMIWSIPHDIRMNLTLVKIDIPN